MSVKEGTEFELRNPKGRTLGYYQIGYCADCGAYYLKLIRPGPNLDPELVKGSLHVCEDLPEVSAIIGISESLKKLVELEEKKAETHKSESDLMMGFLQGIPSAMVAAAGVEPTIEILDPEKAKELVAEVSLGNLTEEHVESFYRVIAPFEEAGYIIILKFGEREVYKTAKKEGNMDGSLSDTNL